MAVGDAKRVEVREGNLDLHSLILSERFIVYLSPSQFNELPESLKSNELFVDFLKVCFMSIPPEILPEDISFQERERHIYDSQRAVALLHETANRGFARAQFLLGQCYGRGLSVRQSHEKAAMLFKKSAEQNYVRAQFSFGFCREDGKGIAQNMEEAVEYYRKAAEQQYLPGQTALARVERKLKAQREAIPVTVVLPKNQAEIYEEKMRMLQKSHEKTLHKLQDLHRKEIQKLEGIITDQNKQLHALKQKLVRQIPAVPE